VPEGPVRAFYERLHDLHAAAGWPSMRQLQRASRSERRPTGINPTTIHDAFSAPKLARWEVVSQIVAQLGGDVDEFGKLWRDARQAQARDADQTAVAERPSGPATPGGQARAVPRELPPDVFAFTGRADGVKRLDELVPADAGSPDAGTAVIAVISGTAGVGKTALAVHWGHRVRDRFPDGQLYLNLRGYSPAPPLRPIEALFQLLRSLGLPAGDIPPDETAAAARYRSLLADRRVLVLLDDAVDPAQVRPLLPASAGSVVLVTSRDRLSGLVARDGARRIALDVLAADDAEALLVRILGAERMAAESHATADLARACAYVPLALRLAAATLTDQPRRGVADYAAALRGDGLEMLAADDDEPSGMRSAFDLSYRALTEDRRRLFRLTGLVPGPDVTAEAAAALAGATVEQAATLLERLAAAHLLGQHAPGRYACHDLLRQYAAERAEADDPPEERNAAVGRLVNWYLSGVDAAAKLAYPHRLRLPVPESGGASPAHTFHDHAAALAWLDAERANLIAAIVHTAAHGPRPVAWLLADALRPYLWLRLRVVDLEVATDAALYAAEVSGDLSAQSITLLNLANLHHRARRYADAAQAATRALDLAARAGWMQAQAAALGVLGTVHRDAGEMDEAAVAYSRALALYRADGSRAGEALTLNHLGRTYWYLGRLDDALDVATRSLEFHRESGSRAAEAAALDTLGEICQAGGLLDRAIEHHERALALARDIGDRGAEVYALRNLAEAHRDRQDSGRAAELARSAVILAREAGDIRIEADALNTLGTIRHALGHSGEAAAYHREALGLVEAAADPYPQIQSWLGLAAACAGLGRADEALEHARRAEAAARDGGFRLLEARARALLDRVHAGAPGAGGTADARGEVPPR
jgi:tetratricopeptide (TPR) repeat protein